jgi:hypothetical protein
MVGQRQFEDGRQSGAGGVIALVLIGGAVLLLGGTCAGIGFGVWYLTDTLVRVKNDLRPDAEIVVDIERPRVFQGPPPNDGPKVDPMQAMMDQRFADGMRDWKPFRSEKGKFSVDLPVKHEGVQAPNGDTVMIGGAVVNQLTSVSSSKRFLDEELTPLEAAEAAARLHVQDQTRKKLLTLNGHPGVELRTADGKRAVRAYGTPTRVYKIIVLTHQAPQINKESKTACSARSRSWSERTAACAGRGAFSYLSPGDF